MNHDFKQDESAVVNDLADLLGRAEELLASGGRRLLGITGPPGAGKSTLANWLEAALTERHDGPAHLVTQIPMDGFHLSNAELAKRGLSAWKGAPQTFDAEGYGQLLRRARQDVGRDLFAPAYSRELHEPVADAHRIPPTTRLVISEGNYLLLDTGPWASISALFDEVWFVLVDTPTARERLIARQIAGGRPSPDAEEWVDRSDMANLALVNASRSRADLLIKLPQDAYS